MKYLIDGYNLMGEIRIISFEDPDKEAKLVQFLVNRRGRRNDRFEIIFDGKNPYYDTGYKETVNTVSVRYTAHDETADDVIIAKLSRVVHKKNIIVVSSDNQIRNAAKKARVTVLRSAEFLAQYQPERLPEPDKPDTHSEDDVSFWMDHFKPPE